MVGTGPQKFSGAEDRKSTRLNSSHSSISYAVFCLKKQTTASPSPTATHSGRAHLTRPVTVPPGTCSPSLCYPSPCASRTSAPVAFCFFFLGRARPPSFPPFPPPQSPPG